MAHKHENACPIPDEICAAYREQQRIIKLLEERSKCGSEHDYDGYCYCEEIQLIKGEHE